MPREFPGEEFSQGYHRPEPVPYTPSAGSSEVSPYFSAFPATPPLPMTVPANTFPVQKRRLRGHWIVISLLAFLLLASIGSFFAISYLNHSTPDKTLDAFCTALQQADYQSAYNQFSTQLQHTFSEAAFAALFSQDKVIACTHGSTGETGSQVLNTLKIVHASKGVNDDIITLTKEGNNEWKINDIYKAA